ncbi:unnamed protein product [Diamesa hyperborea]
MDVITIKSGPSGGGFFTLPDEVKDKILRYLTFQEMLNCSLVAKCWYEYIGKSEKSMKKCILRYGHPRDYANKKPKKEPKKKDAQSIQNSKRNYHTLDVTLSKRGHETAFLPTKAWRKVQLNVGKFTSKLDYFRYLSLFPPTLYDLRINFMKDIGKNDTTLKLEFPALEYLMFESVPLAALEPFMVRHKKLKLLCLEKIIEPKKSLLSFSDVMKDILRLNTTLMDLRMTDCNLFSEDLSQKVTFKLRNLVIKFPANTQISYNKQQNLSRFIKLQGKTLVELSVSEWVDLSIIYRVWDTMTMMRQFTILSWNENNNFEPCEEVRTIAPNPKLTHIYLLIKNMANSWLFPLLTASPNLTFLFTRKLTRDISEFVALNMMNVRSLKYEFIDFEFRPFYEELKKSPGVVNREITLLNRYVKPKDD